MPSGCVKDEFFHNSAAFSTDSSLLVFAMARKVVIDDNKNADIVKLQVLDVTSQQLRFSVECGEKKFHSLLLKDDRFAILAWTDCSFDVYDVTKGASNTHLPAPDSRLVIQQCFLTRDDYLVGLSSSQSSADRKYFALWFWSLDDGTSVNLLTQTYEESDDIPESFIIVEDLRLALLASGGNATLSVWDLPNSECVFSTRAHKSSFDNIVRMRNSYQFITCSSGEEVVKVWDIYDVLRRSKQDKQV